MQSKQWRCKNGHILGSIQWNGSKVPYLALYRHAINEKADLPEAVDVIGPLMGRMPVTCDVEGCGCVKLWDVQVDALVEIFKGLSDEQVFDFSQRLLEKGK